jgi:oligoendopeptidase F
MALDLPKDPLAVLDWDWQRYKPFYDELGAAVLNAGNLEAWMSDWTALASLVSEAGARIKVALDLHADDPVLEARYTTFLEKVGEPAQAAEQLLKERLLASGLEPAGFAIPLRNMRQEAALFRTENLPLATEHEKTALEYDRVVGSRTVQWEGEELTVTRLVGKLSGATREVREKGWRLGMERVLSDSASIDDVWTRLMGIRAKIAKNALCADYRGYTWKQRLRFDYGPKDCETFRNAIETSVVPAARRVYERRAKRLGVATLRPWDVSVDVMRQTDINVDCFGRPALRPFADVAELETKIAGVFHRVDPRLGAFFETMKKEGLYDLANYKGKTPGAYCTGYNASRRPFVFMNAAGGSGDVDTLLHEMGHAFHQFRVYGNPDLKYYQSWDYPLEFAEVASMGMELLGSPFLTKDKGAFYTEEEAARAAIMHMEQFLLFWPFMACVDGFQHWAYEAGPAGADPAACDAAWAGLWDRFIQGVDWSGLETAKAKGWQRKLHPFHYPFYYTEYGFAQLGAVQIYKRYLEDSAGAVTAYLHGLSLGGSVTLPELFKATGGRFAFDAAALKEAADLLEERIAIEEKKL